MRKPSKQEKRERARLVQQERQRKFDEQCERLRAQVYAAKEVTLDEKKANVYGVLTALPFVAAAAAAYFFLADRGAYSWDFIQLFATVAIFLLSIPVHEGLHGLVWGIASGSFRGIRFGIMPALFTPYCTCERPMRRFRYLAGVAAPFVVLGVGCSVAACLCGNFVLALAGMYNILCAGADLYIAFRLIAAGGEIVADHPSRCGFVCFFARKTDPEQ